MEKSKKEMENEKFLEKLEENGIQKIEFKKENLGALEFELEMMTKNFKKEKLPFRVERVSNNTFMKLEEKLNDIEGTKEFLKTFIAFPVEARDLEFFNLDLDAMGMLMEAITTFQITPSLFIEKFGKN